ncbi:bifunctional 2',3'-cyclic-nucleotide 2'-phosphodiesterase/3'-nucleotidase [Alkalihalophilus pseudofirmus]|uniref:Bifunctional 2',3'-cyclic-nucleotide 2'-phosphodiesterase/3'-nucleotidase n=1 Tax=Alkalihalophilus pseudofirmus TaxID=79885 RepID=A0AAJ2U376_ALKPS|nr:bifunctional 2',3'-cyclic-nucleotide 2'-phosphodiesterase/3'-nucleotidase [Alkalihalophilus pseudofirmus]MDV2886335.1 bifunctional 2',3'-cyclic-nucleotide 2'-phosphodiesterase/3'-nucleotidase [Alkalihalophilus pseudofirmus]
MSKSLTKMMSVMMVFTLMFSLFSFPAADVKAEENDTLKVRVLGTTDIHAHIMNYDYYADRESNSFGLVKLSTLIKELREDHNTILVDNGDLIQGNPLGEYVHNNLKEGELSPIIAAMNLLDFDAGTLGNHEFNYGLDFLENTMAGANFPIVSANVFTDDGGANDQPHYDQYVIVDREFVDENGETHTVKVGLTGFVTPQIMTWDAGHLTGKVVTKDITETAKKVIPQMKEEGAELIVAIAHSGIETREQPPGAENAVYDLTKVEGIDAVVSGHQHGIFPGDSRFNNVDTIDNEKGTVNGVPVVMANNWGSHVGMIDLDLEKVDGDWTVADSQSAIKSAAGYDVDEEMAEAVKEWHEGTLEYVRSPVGTTTAPINSFFALVQDDPSVQIVNDAQVWYVQDKLKDTEYADLPIISAAAPFKAGGRNGAEYYTNIPAGDIAIRNVGDLYLYDNTVKAVKLTGAEVKEWLEMSAGQFNTINPEKSEEQPLINEEFRSFNFDVIDGVEYQIDVTQKPKYAPNGDLINEDSSRVVNLTYNGSTIDLEQEFIVVTNNYRAYGGGDFPNLTSSGSNVIYKSPDENRQALIMYIEELKEINPSADNNWSLAPIEGNVNTTFLSSPDANTFAEELEHISLVGDGGQGFAKYAMNLSQQNTPDPEPEPVSFPDIPAGFWAKEYIETLAAKEIFTGKKNGTFAPSEDLTRGQFVVLLTRALGLETSTEYAGQFTDVSGSEWFNRDGELVAAIEAGIINGKRDGTFAPNESLTRVQAASMITRAMNHVSYDESKLNDKTLSHFKDADSIDEVVKEDVETVLRADIMTGTNSNEFNARGAVSRAQMSKMLHNFLEFVDVLN